MAKKAKSGVVVVKCACSVCGQVSNAQADSTHFGCVGVGQEFFAANPRLKGRFSRPMGKGVWVAV